MRNRLDLLWGKTDKEGSWNPLLLHLIDVAACAEAVLNLEPFSTRQRMAEILGLEWDDALPWILFVIACHDLGKACPGFQFKDCAPKDLKNIDLECPIGVDLTVHHGFVSQIAINDFLIANNWPDDLADKVSDAVGCHHGKRATPSNIEKLHRKSIGDKTWADARNDICLILLEIFQPKLIPTKVKLTGPDFMLLAGLTSFSDWIGSNVDWFPFGKKEDTNNLKGWLDLSRIKAKNALNKMGWSSREPLALVETSFEQIFNLSPRPLQEAVAKIVKKIDSPSILLVEAPMGEGKTEAAFYAHLELQRRFGHRGLYIALPTKATGNAMFKRTLDFLQLIGSKRNVDLQLLHGATILNEEFQKLRLASIYTSDKEESGVSAGEWFTHKKRALLSEYGVGTIDQALLSILPVRHQFVRLWGLANRVVVFDEIHAYDAYTGTLLIELIRWLIALNTSVILLSATLPPAIRKKLAEIMDAKFPEQDVTYPRLSSFSKGEMSQVPFDADPSRRCLIKIEGISSDLAELKKQMEIKLVNGGMGLILVNTVSRAQELYQLFSKDVPYEINGSLIGKKTCDGTEIILFHARFPANKRQEREDFVISIFGKNGLREGRKILIATQVAEQSLDLDFDCIITDLAPIDLLLQRAGRLWRHQRSSRLTPEPVLLVAGLEGKCPPRFEEPLWWSSVYREDILLRTWVLLKTKTTLELPKEIDDLVQNVYEEKIIMPEFLYERLDQSLINGEGEAIAEKNQAYSAIIGFPDDGSWNDPSKYIKCDDDEAGIHPNLIAQTRLGEPSVTVIPIFSFETSQLENNLDFHQAKKWCLRSLSVSRKGVVKRLQSLGKPESWKNSSLLRNCYPLKLDVSGCWEEDSSVRLDNEVGLIYVKKEKNEAI